ncbi:kinase-like protein [Lojkania enalia]|uniref:Kinase-like protein n=1 Tax=Lojkania enalia TaxID=147567 RepID=A0A9P4K980_9PLEO|nr:kinase-like protein [Didymosphaeria enalia]
MEHQAPVAPDSRDDIEASLGHIIPRKPFPQYVDDTIFLEIQDLLSQHPERRLRAWSDSPRLYTLLRMLGHDDESQVFQKFESEQISDIWLPLPPTTLNQLSSSVGLAVSEFRLAQFHVLSPVERMGEDKLVSDRSHRYIRSGPSFFRDIDVLGTGGSAEVVRVQHQSWRKEFACKRIRRAAAIKDQRIQLVEFEQEVAVLQRIAHHHLVSFVACFTDLNSFSLILNPVANDVLKSVLARQSREQPLPEKDIKVLRQSFGCLTTALSYLHEQKIRHKDIKPGNILLSNGKIFLCDFGISRDWSKNEHSTTEGDVLKFTRRYCAPEVLNRDARNSSADIWSLGCVFLELITVIKGYPLEEMNQFMLEHSVGASEHGLWCAPEAMMAWIVKLRSNESADDIPLDWITPMIRSNPDERSKPSEILDLIHKKSSQSPHPDLFLAACCCRSDSISPIDAVTATTSPEAFSPEGLGISNASSRRSYLEPPQRTDSSTSTDRMANSPGYSRRSESRERSISPRTQSLPSLRGSDDIVPFQMDSPFPTNRSIQPPPVYSDTPKTSQAFSFVPRPPESVASSGFQIPPVPPPASFEVRCFCASQADERHIFNGAFVSCDVDPTVPTVETCPRCEMSEDRIQVYESPEDISNSNTSMPMIWWVTRRLVISYLSGSPELRRCSSFWLPLADLQYTLIGTEVVLWWSDCNQMTGRQSGNYGQHYDWLYNAKQPNNTLTLRFSDRNDAQIFIDSVRLPYQDGVTVRHRRRTEVSASQEVEVFDIGRTGVRNYRVAVLTTDFNSRNYSKLFIQWPELDLDIRIRDAEVNRFANSPDFWMMLDLHNVSTPTYHSDVRGEPAVDEDKVARFSKALQLKTSLAVAIPMGMKHGLPAPPSRVVELMYCLTGWTLRYFGFIEKFKSKNRRFGNKKHGRADIMLWEKEVEGSASKRHGSQVTFRQHDEADPLWTSGSSTNSLYASD